MAPHPGTLRLAPLLSVELPPPRGGVTGHHQERLRAKSAEPIFRNLFEQHMKNGEKQRQELRRNRRGLLLLRENPSSSRPLPELPPHPQLQGRLSSRLRPSKQRKSGNPLLAGFVNQPLLSDPQRMRKKFIRQSIRKLMHFPIRTPAAPSPHLLSPDLRPCPTRLSSGNPART